MRDPYRLSDRVILILARLVLTRVKKAKKALLVKGFDELNVIHAMEDLYDGMDRDNRETFRELYCWRYIEVLLDLRKKREADELVEMYLIGWLPLKKEEIRKMDSGKLLELAEKTPVPKGSRMGKKADRYLKQLLETPNPVTQVAYDAEVFRKRDRAAEAVNAAAGKRAKQIEIDRQTRYWSRASDWYADLVTEDANEDAIRDAGYTRVRWITQRDGKVCAECERMDGLIFPINRVPELRHRACRCYVIPIKE